MARRLFRWIRRTAIMLAVLIVIVTVSDYLSHRVSPGSILVVALRGPVVERSGPAILGLLDSHQTPLNLLRRAIATASRDPRIAGLALEVIDPVMELAQAQEIAAMVRGFRERGKFTTAYLESAGELTGGNLPYLVASSAGKVSIMPRGDLALVGVGVREIFARGTLDWLGIRPNFGAIGKYKTAANVYTQSDFTAAEREQDEALVGNLYDQIVAQVARQRNLSVEKVREIIDTAPLGAREGLKAGLVDRLEYEDEFVARVRKYRGQNRSLINYRAYARPWALSSWFKASDRIAVIYGEGAIVRGRGGFDPFSSPLSAAMASDAIAGAFKAARENSSIRAVVFRINSPGGSVIGSELIRRQVELTARKKPVVVSMSGYAASGGYWIATAAKRIVSQPGTITGSIGVLGGKFNIAPAAKKLHLNTASITRGANAEMFDSFTDFTPEQRKIFERRVLGRTYHYFLTLVAAARRLKLAQVDEVAQGRVWTGSQAIKLKLVDRLGGLDEALAEAKSLAGIAREAEVGISELPARPGLLQTVLRGRLGAQSGPRMLSIRMLRPIMMMVDAALGSGGAFGAVYCPIVPII